MILAVRLRQSEPARQLAHDPEALLSGRLDAVSWFPVGSYLPAMVFVGGVPAVRSSRLFGALLPKHHRFSTDLIN